MKTILFLVLFSILVIPVSLAQNCEETAASFTVCRVLKDTGNCNCTGPFDFLVEQHLPPRPGNCNITSTLNFTVSHTVANYSIGIDGTQWIRMLNCSPDWEFYPSSPENQTDSRGIINVTNDGTQSGDLRIRVDSSLNTGWTLWACRVSTSDPKNHAWCEQLSTTWQTLFQDVKVGERKMVWIYANCSHVSTNPGASIEMEGVS